MEDINSRNTKLCRKCKMPIDKKASKCPHCQASQTSSCITVLVILIIVVLLIMIGIPTMLGYLTVANAEQDPNVTLPAVKITTSATQKVTTSPEDYMSECTFIPYETIARNPNKYKGTHLKYYGRVIQTLYSDTGTEVSLRIVVSEKDYPTGYDDVILASMSVSSSDERILEDDAVIIYGDCMGDYTYESVLGAKITLPLIDIKYMERYEKPDPITVDENGNQTFMFDGFEISIGSNVSFSIEDNKYSDDYGKTIVDFPVTITNKNSETAGLNYFYVKAFGSLGTESSLVSTFRNPIFSDLRPEASISGYFSMYYDGDGDYYFEFDKFSDEIEVKISVKK